MSGNHTSGPWEVRGSRIVAVNVKPDWADINEDYANERVNVVDLTSAMGGEDSDADARLIAAAPELLAYLERLVGFASHYAHQSAMDAGGDLLIKNARAVIAKAIGAPHDH